MMTKLVSLSDEAYATLAKMKGKDMSFSQVILKLVYSAKPKRDFTKLAGTLKSETKELDKFKKQIKEDRQRNVEVD